MTGKDNDAFMDRYWPLLMAGCGALILWYLWGGNRIAGGMGFLGIGWLAWDRLIKPKL